VVVLERDDRIGGLLRYGIPEFKMEKRHIDRRVEQMTQEGTEFRVNAAVGDNVDIDVLVASHDAVVLACGATQWRDLPVDKRHGSCLASGRRIKKAEIRRPIHRSDHAT
jgi:glutamate synthase (NADPH/NADH) small chain